MERTDFELLKSTETQVLIEKHLGDDPAQIALGGVPSAVATQVKYLQRARTKLPAFYTARCILPPRAFEQASSEQTADHKRFTGHRAIDLTCGLGVDTACLAKNFDEVIAIERDPLLADIARYNFDRLGLRNVQVINLSAEEFVATTELHADLVYADPDRRCESNRKQVLLEDYSPNIVLIHSRLHEIAPRVVMKVSPLFDFAEAFRIFGPHTRAEAVSLGDEVKELLIETGAHIPHPVVCATAIGSGSVEWPAYFELKSTFRYKADAIEAPSIPTGPPRFSPPYRYLLLPDAALRKMRMAHDYFESKSTFIDKVTGYAFADHLPEGGMYRAWRIEAIHPYKPKEIKRLGIKQLQIMQRDFPLANARIAKQVGIREGGTQVAAFTTIAGVPYMILLLPLRND